MNRFSQLKERWGDVVKFESFFDEIEETILESYVLGLKRARRIANKQWICIKCGRISRANGIGIEISNLIKAAGKREWKIEKNPNPEPHYISEDEI